MNMRNRRTPQKKNQAGYTLLELAISLVVIAALIAGSSNFTQMNNAIRTKFSDQGSFQGLTNATLISNGIVPESMLSGAANTINTSWGTPATYVSASVFGAPDDGFTASIPVPAKSCSDFVMGMAGTSAKVSIGATLVKDVTAGDEKITPDESGLCGASATNNANVTVVLSLGR